MSQASQPAGPGAMRLGAALSASVLAVSSSATAILLAAPLDPAVIGAGRVAVTGLALALLGASAFPAAVAKTFREPDLRRRVAGSAALLALHFATWIAALQYTTVLRAAALVSTQPLFAGLLARFVGERAPLRLYVGASVAMAGTVVMVVPGSDGTAGASGSLFGDALAVVGSLAAAAYLTIGRSVRDRLPLQGYLAQVHFGAALWLALLAGFTGGWPPSDAVQGTDWLAVLYLGLAPGLVGHGLMNWAVRHVPVHVVSLAILLEPIGAAILAWIILGRGVGPAEALGAAILIGGIAIGLPRRRP